MFLVFQSIFDLARPVHGAGSICGKNWLADLVTGSLASGPLRSLLVDGVIKGVGAVIVFIPQIMILFAIIAVLEDCGYMARAAFLMDRLMSRAGSTANRSSRCCRRWPARCPASWRRASSRTAAIAWRRSWSRR